MQTNLQDRMGGVYNYTSCKEGTIISAGYIVYSVLNQRAGGVLTRRSFIA